VPAGIGARPGFPLVTEDVRVGQHAMRRRDHQALIITPGMTAANLFETDSSSSL